MVSINKLNFKCGYCEYPIPYLKSKIVVCGNCKRTLFVSTGIFGNKSGEVKSMPLTVFIVVALIPVCLFPALFFMYKQINCGVVIIASVLFLGLGVMLLQDGLLSVKTRIDKMKNSISSGGEAVFWGIFKICLSIVFFGTIVAFIVGLLSGKFK